MDQELVDRLRRLREAHAVLAVELSSAQRALRDARGETAALRAELERERRRRVSAVRSVRLPVAARV